MHRGIDKLWPSKIVTSLAINAQISHTNHSSTTNYSGNEYTYWNRGIKEHRKMDDMK